jgi:hypothetical protein
LTSKVGVEFIESAEPSVAFRLLRFVWRRTARQPFEVSRALVRIIRNALMERAGRSDYQRWTSPRGLEEWWDERTNLLAKLVPPGSKVIEFGAGRRQLEKLLPSDCSYTPSDLVDRGAGTLVCDLNRRPLADLSHITPDVAIFSGVLEYIRDVPDLARWLAAEGVKTCLSSFDPAPADLGLVGRWREWRRRSYYGYMNGLTEDELRACFKAAGFNCVERHTWTTQVILRFLRDSQTRPA